MNTSHSNPTSQSSIFRHRSFQRRGSPPSSSSFRPRIPTSYGQSYLTYEDLHARCSPHSPPLRMPRVQRPLSADDLLRRFRDQRTQRGETAGQHREMKGQDPPAVSILSPPPAVPPDLETSDQRGEIQGQSSPTISAPFFRPPAETSYLN